MEDCWAEDPHIRPTADKAISRLDVIRPVDQRPAESQDTVSPISFRDSMGGRYGESDIRDLEALITNTAIVGTSISNA